MKSDFNLQQFIFSLEKKYPVSSWRINEIDVWPIIRVKLQTKANNNLARKPSNYSNKKNLSYLSKIKSIFSSYFLFYSLKKVDFIATSNFSHLSVHQKKIFNKFYSPILDDVNSNGIIIEHNTKYFPTNIELNNPDSSIFFEDFTPYLEYSYFLLKKLRIYKPSQIVDLKNYNSFLQELKSIKEIDNLHLDFEIINLQNITNKISLYSKIYKRILRKTKPEFTFQICHYSMNSVALSLASRESNIPSVEIQHGGQQRNHMAYGDWTNTPENGYNTLPNIYWNWDQESLNNQQEWINKSKFHHSINLGNPWLNYIKKKTTKQKKEYIMYSLQPVKFEFLFPKYLIDYIKNNRELLWWFRIHPTDVNRKLEYLNFFKKEKIYELIIFDEGDKLSLPETLMKSIVHVTYSSGVIIEAERLGIKTLILDTKNGAKNFESYIQRKKAFLVNQENFIEKLDYSIENRENPSEESKSYLNCFTELNLLKN